MKRTITKILLVLTDPPTKTIDDTSVDDFKDLLNLNLVNYFIFCKVSDSYFKGYESRSFI